MDSKHDGLEIVSPYIWPIFSIYVLIAGVYWKILRWEVKKGSPLGGVVHPILQYKMGSSYKLGVHTPTVGFYKMATPRVVLMLHALLECACDPFCRKGILTFKMIGKNSNPFCGKGLVEPTFHFLDLYKMKLILKRRDDLQNGVSRMGWLL